MGFKLVLAIICCLAMPGFPSAEAQLTTEDKAMLEMIASELGCDV